MSDANYMDNFLDWLESTTPAERLRNPRGESMRDDGLIEFLAARLAEDEAAAKARESGAWIPLAYDEGTPSPEEAAYIARHGPARVLREVWAKRAMLAELTRWPFDYRYDCDDPTRLFVRLLAAAYSDHPDYRQEWDIKYA